MSRAGDDVRLDEKFRFEKIIATINDEKRVLSEKYRLMQQQIINAEEEIHQWKSVCEVRTNEVEELH